MCQHPATTNNGYDTWSAGPSIVDPTHVGNAETSGCQVWVFYTEIKALSAIL